MRYKRDLLVKLSSKQRVFKTGVLQHYRQVFIVSQSEYSKHELVRCESISCQDHNIER